MSKTNWSTLFILLLVILAGCSMKPAPEKAVETYVRASIAGDVAKMNKVRLDPTNNAGAYAPGECNYIEPSNLVIKPYRQWDTEAIHSVQDEKGLVSRLTVVKLDGKWYIDEIKTYYVGCANR